MKQPPDPSPIKTNPQPKELPARFHTRTTMLHTRSRLSPSSQAAGKGHRRGRSPQGGEQGFPQRCSRRRAGRPELKRSQSHRCRPAPHQLPSPMFSYMLPGIWVTSSRGLGLELVHQIQGNGSFGQLKTIKCKTLAVHKGLVTLPVSRAVLC